MRRFIAAFCTFSMGFAFVPALVAQTTVVNHLTMNQWVQSTDSGELKGRVVLPKDDGQFEALEGVDVAISTRDGDVLRGKTDAKGEFVIAGVQSGVYALTARGENVFACCAMHVIDAGIDDKFPTSAEISVANVDYTIVNTAVIRYLPPNVRTPDVSISTAELASLATRVCGNDMFRVAQSDGGMKGRLHLAGAQGADLMGANLTNVFLFKDAMEIDRTLTDSEGQFAFENIQAGHYSVLAIGEGGVGLIGFELVNESELAETAQYSGDDDGRLVGIGGHNCCCPEFAMQIAPMPEVVSCVEEVIVSETIVDTGCGDGCETEVACCEDIIDDGFCSPMAGGGYHGGGGGGYSGGGGGGGGGFGGIAALAALGAIAASNSGGGGAVILPPVIASPSVP